MTTTTHTQPPALIGPFAPATALPRLFRALVALFDRTDRDVSLSARELRAMADRYEASQPSFAADLRAAADRQA